MSQLNLGTAMFAGKAFLIATGLVTIGGGLFAWAVKTVLGVEHVRFSYLFRSFVTFFLLSLLLSSFRGEGR